MTDAVLYVESFQELIDGPGELGQADHGKVPAWDATAERFVMVVLPQPKGRGGGIILGAAPMTIQQATDGPGVLDSGDNGKALTWNNSTGRFLMATINAADADTLDGHDSTYFLAADGTTPGATSQAQIFTNGIAINKTSPACLFDMASAETPAGSSNLAVHIGNTGGNELITSTSDRDFSSAGNWTGTNWAISSGTFKHTAGSTANATLANANLTASSIISGRYYQVSYTITGRTAGTIQPKIGTGLGTAQSVDGTYTDYIAAAANNADLIFTPTSAFDGAIDNVSVQRISTNFVVGNNGKVGVGTTTPLLALEVIDGTNTPLNIVRRSAITSASSGTFNAVHETSGVALDGFGAHQSFRIKDNTSGTTFTIGTIGAVRDGAQDTGALVFRTTTANVVNERMRISTNGHIGLGASAPTARIHVAGNASFAAWGLNGIGLQLVAATFTDNSTAASGTATNGVVNSFGRPTLAAANSSVTITNAATLYIANSPASGTNVTITNPYAVWIDDGNFRLDGHFLTGDATANTNTPSGATAYKFPIYDQTGTLLGYIPVYGSAW